MVLAHSVICCVLEQHLLTYLMLNSTGSIDVLCICCTNSQQIEPTEVEHNSQCTPPDTTRRFSGLVLSHVYGDVNEAYKRPNADRCDPLRKAVMSVGTFQHCVVPYMAE